MRWTTMFRPVSRFENAKLEELWQAKRNDKLNTFDLGFVLIFAVPTLIVVVKALQVEVAPVDRIVPPVLLSLIYGSLGALIWQRPAAYIRNRGWVLSCFKLAYILMSCNMALVEAPATDTWFHFFRFELFLFQRGILALIVGLSLPQPFLQHCAVQSCLLLLDLINLPGTCLNFNSRQPSNYGRYQQIVTAMDLILTPSTHPSRRDCPLAFCGQTYCMHVQAFLNVMTGFVLPGLVIYAMECRSRLKFLQGRPDVTLISSGNQKPCKNCAMVVLYMANVFIGMALLWHWLGWLHALKLHPYSLHESSNAPHNFTAGIFP